jgi:HK97 family phage portal protein
MSVLDTLRSLITGGEPSTPPAIRDLALPTERRALDIFTSSGIRTADWSTVNDMPRLMQSARVCVTVYACATYLADAVAESPLRVYREVNGEKKPDHGHPARLLIAQPNPALSEAEFMTLTIVTMAYCGYAAIEKVRSPRGRVVELWPLRPDWLERERLTAPDERGNTWRWLYRVPNMDPRRLSPDDVLIVPYRHDDRLTTFGVSPLHIAAREVGIDVGLTDLLKVFLDAGGVPPYVFEFDEELDPAEVIAFQETWSQKYGGSKAFGKVPVLHGGWKFHKVGDGINDMAWPDLRGLTELKVAQAFRVPAELIQSREAMGGSGLTTTEMDGAMSALQRYGAAPLRARIDGAFTRGLLAEFDDRPGYSLEFDTSDILALQEDRDALHNRVRADWQAGLITLNEARLETDRTPLGAQGDVFAVPFSVSLVSAGGFNDAAERGTIREADYRAVAATTRQESQERRYRNVETLSHRERELRASSIARTNKDRQRLAEILTRKLRVFFREQGQRIVSSLDERSASGLETRDVAVTVDWDDEQDRLRVVLDTFYLTAGEKAFAGIADTIGITLDWDLANPNIRRVLNELGQRIDDIGGYTRQRVAEIVTDGLAEGKTVDDIADRLSGFFLTRSRAETIARTESAIAYNRASVLGYQESGVVSAVELADNRDHDADPAPPTNTTCAERDGLLVGLDEVGDYIESMHPNCVMATIPVLATPLGE